ncbi:MAG: hypothetical protein WBR13_02875 [Allosphingosinicella sp.]
MKTETGPWDSAEFLDSPEAILACLNAEFEGGDPDRIALALNNAARAKGVARGRLTAESDIASVVRTLKNLGLELTVKAA